jgi:hypothetical protein
MRNYHQMFVLKCTMCSPVCEVSLLHLQLQRAGGEHHVFQQEHRPNIYKDTKHVSLLAFNRVYRLEIQSAILVFSTPLVN